MVDACVVVLTNKLFHNPEGTAQVVRMSIAKTMKLGYLEIVVNCCKAMLSFNHEVVCRVLLMRLCISSFNPRRSQPSPDFLQLLKPTQVLSALDAPLSLHSVVIQKLVENAVKILSIQTLYARHG